LDAAETLLEEIQDPTGRTLVQVAIIKACAATELNKQGQRVLVTALAETKSQTDAATRADAYTHLAEAQLAMKQKEAAQETLGAALESSGEIERVYKRVYTLCDIATAYSRAGDKAQAQKTLAQAEKLIAKVPEPDLQSDATEHVNKLAEKLR
jgi:Tfp pilus assembly protein PilF